MLRRKVQKVKDSYLITLPKQLCAMEDIDQTTIMEVRKTKEGIVFTPVTATCQDESVIGAATHQKVCA